MIRLNSLIGVLALVVVIIFGNVIVSRMGMRMDITEDELYTLSDGSKNILKKLEEPVTFKIYFSKSLEGVPFYFKNYYKRVHNMLEEYYHESDMINIEEVDPMPDSEEEDDVQKYGIQARPVAAGVQIYFGMVISNFAGEEIIPHFDASREELLEYDVTRAIHLLNLKGKPKVGLLSSLEILGIEAPKPQFGQPPPPKMNLPKPWLFTMELKKFYDLQKIEASAESIPTDIDLLLVMQAKDLSEKMKFAIDQYVLSGKNVVFIQDPLHYAKQSQNQNQMQPPAKNETLKSLFNAWGIEFDAEKIALDPIMAQQNSRFHPGVPKVTSQFVSKEQITTAGLKNMDMIFPGAVKSKGKEGIKFFPLITMSKKSKLKEKFFISRTPPEELRKSLQDEGEALHLAGLFKGKFKSSFNAAPGGVATKHIKSSEKESYIAVLADIDMFEDQFCLRPVQIFNQILGYQPLNQNTTFLSNLVEQLTGTDDLISLRSKGKSVRPFDRVADMENDAREQFLSKQKELEGKKKELDEKIQSLLQGKGAGQTVIVTPEVQKDINRFKDERKAVQKDLRKVKFKLTGNIKSLGNNLKLINILLLPVLIMLFGLFMGISKFRRVGS